MSCKWTSEVNDSCKCDGSMTALPTEHSRKRERVSESMKVAQREWMRREKKIFVWEWKYASWYLLEVIWLVIFHILEFFFLKKYCCDNYLNIFYK